MLFSPRSRPLRTRRRPPGLHVAFGVAVLLAMTVPAWSWAHDWAEPVRLDGVGNLHRVTATLYRSEQPSAEGMKQLEGLGIRTVINLRRFHSDRKRVQSTGLQLVELEMNTWNVRTDDVVSVLRVLRDERRGPFLVHCQHGADRTGLMIAMYRIVEQGWDKREAIREMVHGGYGYHALWRNLVSAIERADIAAIRAQLAAH